jgi:hypothetical protein
VLCGLANGQLGLADLRMSGAASVVLVTQAPMPAPQPLHSVVALPELGATPTSAPALGGLDSAALAGADCLVATTGGVFAWRQGERDAFAPVARPGPGQSCESICWEEQEALLGVSCRSALDGNGWGQHLVLGPCGGACGRIGGGGGGGAQPEAQREPVWQLRCKLWGNQSKVVMTRGCFVRPYAGGPALYASADEGSFQPWLWQLQPAGVWGRLSSTLQSPVLHLQAGVSSSLGGGVLAAGTKEALCLYSWAAA